VRLDISFSCSSLLSRLVSALAAKMAADLLRGGLTNRHKCGCRSLPMQQRIQRLRETVNRLFGLLDQLICTPALFSSHRSLSLLFHRPPDTPHSEDTGRGGSIN